MKQDNNKKQTHKKNDLLNYRKPNHLIRTKTYDLPSKTPLKMFMGGVAIIQKQQAQGINTRFIKYDIKEFIKITGIRKQELINKIKPYQRELLDYKIEVETPQGVLAFNFINKVFYDSKAEKIIIFFNKNIEIWNTNKNWTSNLLSNLKLYKSKYSIIFYELIKANIKKNNKGIGTFNIYLKDFKDYLGIKEKDKTYKNFHNFKKNILDRIIKEMETIHNIKLVSLKTLKEQVKGSKKINYLSFAFDYSNEIKGTRQTKTLTPQDIIKEIPNIKEIERQQPKQDIIINVEPNNQTTKPIKNNVETQTQITIRDIMEKLDFTNQDKIKDLIKTRDIKETTKKQLVYDLKERKITIEKWGKTPTPRIKQILETYPDKIKDLENEITNLNNEILELQN